MPGKQHDLFIAILEAARCEPIGIVLQCDDPMRARAALYSARRIENNPIYADLQFRAWPYDEGNLVICHSSKPPPPNNLGDIDLAGVLDLDLDT